ncbi:hypothetical protein C8J56DRAFT_125268 [Mycena floridula]|nr:hypothetical protein C8J56DRAFT_125268 [Mycena floridula]
MNHTSTSVDPINLFNAAPLDSLISFFLFLFSLVNLPWVRNQPQVLQEVPREIPSSQRWAIIDNQRTSIKFENGHRKPNVGRHTGIRVFTWQEVEVSRVRQRQSLLGSWFTVFIWAPMKPRFALSLDPKKNLKSWSVWFHSTTDAFRPAIFSQGVYTGGQAKTEPVWLLINHEESTFCLHQSSTSDGKAQTWMTGSFKLGKGKKRSQQCLTNRDETVA